MNLTYPFRFLTYPRLGTSGIKIVSIICITKKTEIKINEIVTWTQLDFSRLNTWLAKQHFRQQSLGSLLLGGHTIVSALVGMHIFMIGFFTFESCIKDSTLIYIVRLSLFKGSYIFEGALYLKKMWHTKLNLFKHK